MDTVQLYHGEALRILRDLADNTIDAVITDPPYSSGGLFTSARTADPAKKYIQTGTKLTRPSFSGDNRDQRSCRHWCTLWISECFRLTREGGYFLMFTDWRATEADLWRSYFRRGWREGFARGEGVA